MIHNVHDIVGIRIVCSFLADVYEIVGILKSSKQFIVKDESDYIKNPKDSGYSSYHINLLVPVHLLDRTEYIEAEVQIRTVAMDCWASLDHKLRYKLPEELPESINSNMNLWANEISNLVCYSTIGLVKFNSKFIVKNIKWSIVVLGGKNDLFRL